MNPALSVILFTTLSGAGYGLLALLGVMAVVGDVPLDRNFGMISLGFAITLVTVGLLSSTLHLKHPERAWRAFSQWRSSWLSREGVLSVVTYGPFFLFAYGWIVLDSISGWIAAAALATSALAVLTVGSTAMIYASLRAIDRWNHPLVLPIYLAFAFQLGAVWLSALLSFFGDDHLRLLGHGLIATCGVWGLKAYYWKDTDDAAPRSSLETATGLTGDIKPFDPPHTEDNFLLQEMGYRIARKHAAKLRRVAVLLGLAAPLFLLPCAWLLTGPVETACLVLAALTATGGALTERWLFFAEAKHSVTIYYG